MAIIKILHTADIQVKVRENDLSNSYELCLKAIHSALISEKINIYLIAGDLFEYANANDAERKIIYSHIANVLKISTISEVVIMAGNHDLLVDKKQLNSNKGNNPIDTFHNFLNSLDDTLSAKITYLKNQAQYISKFNPKLGYISYSLEDGFSNGNNIDWSDIEEYNTNNPDVYNISIYHDILKEYVDDTKLPVRKEKYNYLASIEDFKTPLILAGDIHVNWKKYSGNLDKLFIYPGSPIQRDHSEGSYFYIKKKNPIPKQAPFKSIKIYDVDVDKKTYVVNEHILPDYISYVTLDFNTVYCAENYLEQLKNCLSSVRLGINETFIKLKLSSNYIKKELEIFNAVNEFASTAASQIQIQTSYDKFVIGEDSLKNTEEDVDDETENNEMLENSDSNPDLDISSLILDDKKLSVLFEKVLNNHTTALQKELGDLDLVEEILSSIKALFSEQLNHSLTATPSYNCELESVECNLFMGLGPNKIKLNIPGLTRITGTNGIGKTTLYTIIRWLIEDEILEGMSKKSKTKNSLLVFNNKLINSDTVVVRLIAKVNNTPIALTRSVSRTWKQNTNTEMKQSINWKDHISTITKNVKLQVLKPGEEEKIFTGEEADNLIKKWFGNTTKTIMILNQEKIKYMLNLPSDELSQLVLSYIGVDYLNILENNLESVKLLYNLQRPKQTKEALKQQLLVGAEKINTNIVEKQKLTDYLSQKKLLELEQQKNVEKYNQEKLVLGDIPQLITETTNSITKLNKELSELVILEKKQIPEFNLIKPELSENYTKIETSLLSENNKLTILETGFESQKNNTNVLIDNLTVTLQKQYEEVKTKYNTQFENLAEIFQTELLTYAAENKENFQKIYNIVSDAEKTISEQYTTSNDTIQILNKTIQDITDNITKKQIELKSGICDSCKKPLHNTVEEHEATVIDIQSFIDNHSNELIKRRAELAEKLLQNNNFALIQKVLLGCLANSEANNIDWFKSQENINKPILQQILTTESYDEFAGALTRICGNLYEINTYIKPNHHQALAKNIDYISTLVPKTELINHLIVANSNIKLYSEAVNLLQNKKFADFSELPISNTFEKEKNEITQSINALINLIEEKNNLKAIIDILTEKEKSVKNEYIAQLEIYQTESNNHINLINSINKFNSDIELIVKKRETIDNNINVQTANLKKYLSHQEYYLELTENLLKAKNYLLNIQNSINTCNQEINTLNIETNTFEIQNEQTKLLLSEYIEYQKHTYIIQIYSKLIKKDFRNIVFEYYRNFLNNSLNILLKDLNFKLFWNETGELYMVQIKKGQASYLPVQLVSGMETCFLGLALIYAIHLLNVKNSISNIFIDEISGQLNSGKELTNKTEIQNFQEQLIILLNKFTKKNLFIIDHVIENLYESLTYEVVASLTGSKYIQL